MGRGKGSEGEGGRGESGEGKGGEAEKERREEGGMSGMRSKGRRGRTLV